MGRPRFLPVTTGPMGHTVVSVIKRRCWRIAKGLVNVEGNKYIFTNNSSGNEQCLIFGDNGTAEHPARYNWGPGAYCGFGSKEALLANRQAVFKLVNVEGNKYIITNDSAGNDQCVIFGANGAAEYPARYNWAPGAYCGFGNKEALLANRQAVWTIDPITPSVLGDIDRESIARKYAPVIMLHPNERFMPSSVEFAAPYLDVTCNGTVLPGVSILNIANSQIANEQIPAHNCYLTTKQALNGPNDVLSYFYGQRRRFRCMCRSTIQRSIASLLNIRLSILTISAKMPAYPLHLPTIV